MVHEISARAALKAATQDCHERVDAVFSQAALNDRQTYGRFLAAQAAAQLPVEAALIAGDVARIVPDWPMRERGSLIRQDLADLGREVPPPAGALAFRSPAEVLGGLYVLEGSRLGGQVLKRSVPEGFPSRFLGGVNSAAWRSLLAMLDRTLTTAPLRNEAIASARSVFALFETSGRQHLSLVGAP